MAPEAACFSPKLMDALVEFYLQVVGVIVYIRSYVMVFKYNSDAKLMTDKAAYFP